MSKFTSGKWILKSFLDDPNKGWTIYSEDENLVICQRGPIEGEEFATNAHLIVAAPEMYDTLHEALVELKQAEHSGGYVNEGVISDIEQLLARIDGEAKACPTH